MTHTAHFSCEFTIAEFERKCDAYFYNTIRVGFNNDPTEHWEPELSSRQRQDIQNEKER